MAAPTVIFNISEIALFGIPVIFNPIFLVPFILVPIANFLITYGAIYSGIVPHVVNESLEWDGIERCIADVVEKYHIPNEWFCLEITEQDALSTSIDIADKIKNLKAKGHKFLIDDFGMGHTSLMYLQTSYFNVVKLDGSLTRDILDNERNSDIIGSIVYLGQSLDFKIIAEYVETREQRDELERLGCNAFQGYLYSKPLKLEDLLVWMEQKK